MYEFRRIDLSGFGKGPSTDKAIAKKLAEAMITSGCVFVKVPPEFTAYVATSFKNWSQVVALPSDELKKIEQRKELRGFHGPGVQKLGAGEANRRLGNNHFSHRAWPEWQYRGYVPGDAPWRILVNSPNRFPKTVPEFGKVALRIQVLIAEYNRIFLRALDLGLKEKTIARPYGSLHEFASEYFPVRHLWYPYDEAAANADPGSVPDGIGLHKDFPLTSWLATNAAGLVVLVDGELVPVPVVPGYAFVNSGKVLSAITDGVIQAAPHAVTAGTLKGPKMSVVCFCAPVWSKPFKVNGEWTDGGTYFAKELKLSQEPAKAS